MAEVSFIVHAPNGADTMCIVPSTTHDMNTIQKLRWKHGDIIKSEFKKPRNGKFHRMVFGLLKFVFESQERFDNMEALRRWLTVQTTFVIVATDHATGQLLRMPRSWSYDEMDDLEFEQLYDQVEHVALCRFYPTQDENWLRQAVDYQAFHDGVMAFHDEQQRHAFSRNKIPTNG